MNYQLILIAIAAGTAAGWLVGSVIDRVFFSGVGTRDE